MQKADINFFSTWMFFINFHRNGHSFKEKRGVNSIKKLMLFLYSTMNWVERVRKKLSTINQRQATLNDERFMLKQFSSIWIRTKWEGEGVKTFFMYFCEWGVRNREFIYPHDDCGMWKSSYTAKRTTADVQTFYYLCMELCAIGTLAYISNLNATTLWRLTSQ